MALSFRSPKSLIPLIPASELVAFLHGATVQPPVDSVPFLTDASMVVSPQRAAGGPARPGQSAVQSRSTAAGHRPEGGQGGAAAAQRPGRPEVRCGSRGMLDTGHIVEVRYGTYNSDAGRAEC